MSRDIVERGTNNRSQFKKTKNFVAKPKVTWFTAWFSNPKCWKSLSKHFNAGGLAILLIELSKQEKPHQIVNFKNSIAISKMACPHCAFWWVGICLIGRQYTPAKRHFHNNDGRNCLRYIFYFKTKFGMCSVNCKGGWISECIFNFVIPSSKQSSFCKHIGILKLGRYWK